MKKNIALCVSILASSLMISSYANAAPAALPADGKVDILTCTLLNEDVTIPLSNGVIASFNCGGTERAIQIATCSTNGRTSERTVLTPCGETGQPACAVSPAPALTTVVSGATIYTARSNGGQVGPATFDGAACDTAGLNGKIPDRNI